MNWWDAIQGFLLEQSLIFRSYQALEWSVVWMQIWRLSNYYAVSHQKSVYDVYVYYTIYTVCRMYACLLKSRGLFQPREDPELWRTWCNRSKKILSSKIRWSAKQATRCYKMLQARKGRKVSDSDRKWTFHTAGHPEQHILPLHYNFAVCIALKQVAIASWKAPAWCSWMAKCQLALGDQRSSYGNTVPGKNMKKCYDPFQQRSPNLAELGASSAVVLWNTLWNSKNNSRCLSLAGRTTMFSIS